jgi:hypothetical protein
VSHQQDDWVQWLPLAKFTANNVTLEATKCSPFFTVTGIEPRIGFDSEDLGPQDALKVDADQVHAVMQQVHEQLQVEMRRSQVLMERQANQKRLPAPNIQIGTRVWLDARHIRTTRPCRKLDWKRLGPYTVIEQVSPYVYRLELPRSLRIHPVHHISLIEHAKEVPLPGQRVTPPPLLEIDGDQEYAVERVDDSRIYRNQLHYLVR